MTEAQKHKLGLWLPITLQTLVVLGALYVYGLADEHRKTVIEECQRQTTVVLSDTVETVRTLQTNQIRVIAILDRIEKRHEREDDK
jgi:chemotaxis signal transduction protein